MPFKALEVLLCAVVVVCRTHVLVLDNPLGGSYGGPANISRSYTPNGLNQYASAGGATFQYDVDGNLTSDGATTYLYDDENRLVSASNGTNLLYDPLGRLWQVSSGSAVTQFLYDGDQLAAEYDGSGAMTWRYMFGGEDEPILADAGGALNCSGTRALHTDHQGSIIAEADCLGNRAKVLSYDEHGQPASGNAGSRFQFTGQAWLSELGLYYYKSRFYSPILGRFLQVDPIGYQDQNNLYAYVGNDPVNGKDPLGTAGVAISFESWFALGHGDGPSSTTSYKSETAGVSVSRDGDIELGFVDTTSERGVGFGVGATLGPSFQRGKLGNLSNNNVTAVAGFGPTTVSVSGRASVNARGQPSSPMRDAVNHGGVPLPRVGAKVSGGLSYGGAVFDTSRSKSYVVKFNPITTVKSIITTLIISPIDHKVCIINHTCS